MIAPVRVFLYTSAIVANDRTAYHTDSDHAFRAGRHSPTITLEKKVGARIAQPM